VERRLRQHRAVDDRGVGQQQSAGVGLTDEIGLQLLLSGKEIRGVDGSQAGQIGDAESGEQTFREVTPWSAERALCAAPLWATARRNRPAAAGVPMRSPPRAPGRLTEDRDVGGVASEGGDVVVYPLERGDLVEQSGVAAPAAQGQVGQVSPTERTQSIVDRYDDDVAVAYERRSVVPGTSRLPT
jgi:hypothetical protein